MHRYSLLVFVLLFALPKTASGQELKLLPYQLGDEIRIKVSGMGIEYEGNAGQGLELNLGSNAIDTSKDQLPFMGQIQGLADTEFVESQLSELEEIKNEFMDLIKSEVKRVLSESDGHIDDEKKKTLLSDLSKAQIKFEEKAFDVLLPIQKNWFRHFHFRRAFSASPFRCLTNHADAESLKLENSQLSAVQEIEKESNETIQQIKNDAKAEAQTLVAEKMEKIKGILTPGQIKKLEKILGSKFDDMVNSDHQKAKTDQDKN